MSSLDVSVQLNDKMTPTLKVIDKHLDKLISKFGKLESVGSRAMDKITQSANKISQTITKTTFDEEKLKQSIIKTQREEEKLTQQKMRTQQMIERANNSQNKFNRTMSKGVGVASRLGNAIRVGLGAYLGIQGLSKTIGLADTLQMTTNRLDLLTGGEGTEELKNKIYESAMRSRADYLGTADSIAKMGLRTGDTFKSIDELIAFNETLNKMYAIAGTGAHEQFGATLQLIQALGSGVLRGQEFNAVFEAAPNVLQAVAKHMNVPVEKLREMAEEGAITSDILKNAMFEAAKDTNEQFKKLKYTFGHVFTGLKNSAIHSFQPVLQQISNITSSERWIKFIDGIGVAIDNLARFSSKALNVVTAIASTIFDNWSLITPIIWGIVGALVVYNATLTIGLIKSAIQWAVATYNAIAYQWALFKMAVAQYGFNTALAMCPLSWFLYALVAIVAVFYLIIAIINKFTKVSVSATGLIAGAFAWLGALIANIFIGIFNIGSGVVQAIVNAWNWCSDNMETVFHNIGVWWDNLWIDARVGFYSFINDVLSKLSSLATKIQPLAKLLDVDLSGIIGNAQASINTKISNLESGRRKAKSYTAWQEVDWKTKDYMSLNSAWEKGYNWGANLSSSLTLDELGKTISGITNGVGSDVGKYLKGGYADNPALDDILKNTKDIANNTSVDADKEDLSYMRDMAARDAINRHTTRNVKIEMVNNNSVSGDMDLNMILQQIAKTVNDAVNVNASGIHY